MLVSMELIRKDAVNQAPISGITTLIFGVESVCKRLSSVAWRGSGWGFKVDDPNDLSDVHLTYKEFGEGLDPALRFLPRPGTRWYQSGAHYQPRPRGGIFAWVS